ncbi:exonuclease VIII domain protein [Acinetobacter baumannii]|nr:exonuclease VIII domain protein [Acinetobacter baumannii]
MLFIGEQKRRSAMLTLLQCKESNEWQGYTKQIQPIDLPLWAKKEFLGE